MIVRVFIAIDFNKETKDSIAHIGNTIRKYTSYGNFTRKENFHITLKFIGEVGRDNIHNIESAIKNTTKHTSPFTIVLEDIGRFVRKRKNLIWLGLSDGEEELTHIHDMLDRELQIYRFSRDTRHFKPHVTIGREVDLLVPFEELQKDIDIEPITINVDSLTLMESTRDRGRLIYTPICRYPLS